MYICCMKLKATLAVLSLLFISFVNAQPAFRVFIKQGNLKKEILYNDSTTVLERKPFVFEIWFLRTADVFLNVSYDSLYYNTPLGQNFKDWKYIAAKGMAEDNFNVDRKLVITDEPVHRWFYDSTSEFQRFDKNLTVKGDTIIGTRTVETFIDGYNDGMEMSPLMMSRPLLLVFFMVNLDLENGNTELGRKKTVLIFR